MDFLDLTHEDFGFYITTFEPKHTGLPATIHIINVPVPPAPEIIKPFMLIARSEDKIYDYPDNIKIELQHEYNTVADELLTKTHKFIEVNYDLIVNHWQGHIDFFDLTDNLKSI